MKYILALLILAATSFAQLVPGDRATIEEGKVVTLAVTADGTTPFAYKWFRNGHPLPNSGSTATVTLNRPDEIVPHVTFQYWCEVVNAAGKTASQIVYVKVIPRVPTPEEIEAERLRLEALRLAEELRIAKAKELEASIGAEVPYDPVARTYGPLTVEQVRRLNAKLAEVGL